MTLDLTLQKYLLSAWIESWDFNLHFYEPAPVAQDVWLYWNMPQVVTIGSEANPSQPDGASGSSREVWCLIAAYTPRWKLSRARVQTQSTWCGRVSRKVTFLRTITICPGERYLKEVLLKDNLEHGNDQKYCYICRLWGCTTVCLHSDIMRRHQSTQGHPFTSKIKKCPMDECTMDHLQEMVSGRFELYSYFRWRRRHCWDSSSSESSKVLIARKGSSICDVLIESGRFPTRFRSSSNLRKLGSCH